MTESRTPAPLDEMALFEAWRKTAPWYVTAKAFSEDDDDGKSIFRMMNLAASESWSAGLAALQTVAAPPANALGYMDAEKSKLVRAGKSVVTTITPHKVFDSDVRLFVATPQGPEVAAPPVVVVPMLTDDEKEHCRNGSGYYESGQVQRATIAKANEKLAEAGIAVRLEGGA